MLFLLNTPFLLLPVMIAALLLSGWCGARFRRTHPEIIPAEHKDHFNALETSVLGMLALLLGFTFSMAVSRYDARQQLQISEANAIGTTFLRTSLLPEPQQDQSRILLRKYVEARVQSAAFKTVDPRFVEAQQKTSVFQQQLWQTASSASQALPDTRTSLYITALNEAIDVSEKRTAALENRIPPLAWLLLFFFSLAATFLTGLAMPGRTSLLLVILPIVIGSALTLVADLDAPRGGLIRVNQNSMDRLQRQVNAH